ncbi:hypothetical protein CC80DRAFT_530735 [Byssothecium circinans]|uniref:Uncharacterized protein n=1 Tax=Byssothecium circinans TaxID=147558 RepID=A0A6A5UCD1_9PLEO|nr:hypothetical protein CC80DRAFT_530735 [Byssothecium circinans]
MDAMAGSNAPDEPPPTARIEPHEPMDRPPTTLNIGQPNENNSPPAKEETLASTQTALSDKGKQAVTEQEDTQEELYSLCKVVPYLLAPKSILEQLVALRDKANALPEGIFTNEEGADVLNLKGMSSLDKAMVLVLYLLTQTVHPGPVEDMLKMFNCIDNKLILWKHMGEKLPPERTHVGLYDFAQMVTDWSQTCNPALVADDYPWVVTPWVKIISYLKRRRIPIESVEIEEYEEWTMLPEDMLEKRLDSFVASGKMDKNARYSHLRSLTSATKVRKGMLGNVLHIQLPNPTDPTLLGAKRFSHKHPLGQIVDYSEERHDNALLPEEREKDLLERLEGAPQAVTGRRRLKAWLARLKGRS